MALRLAGLVLALAVVSSACLADPQRDQISDLLGQLSSARSMFAEQPPRIDEGCDVVGDVQTRLQGEPGLTNVQPAWPELRDATDALNAVCGQARLLAQLTLDTAAGQAARQRWQQGIQREMGVACDHLRAAAAALGRSAPC
jgi:hypothetical protein